MGPLSKIEGVKHASAAGLQLKNGACDLGCTWCGQGCSMSFKTQDGFLIEQERGLTFPPASGQPGFSQPTSGEVQRMALLCWRSLHPAWTG